MSSTFELAGAIKLDDVPDVRRFVEKVHKRIVHDRDDVSRVTMAAHELLENAVKFSADGTASLQIAIDDKKVSITTRNRARATDVDDLRRIADQMGKASDPMAFYLSRMQRSPESRGGLGLGRVAAEGEMEVRFKLEGDLVEISALSSLQGS